MSLSLHKQRLPNSQETQMTIQKNLVRILLVLSLALAALALGVAPAGAQIVGGNVGGAIHDSTGAALSGATVTVRQTDTGFTRTLVTGSDGRYAAPSVPVGHYTISAAHDGFQPQEQTGMVLVIGQSVQVDFTLSVNSVRETIVVEAGDPVVNTTSQQTAGLVDERQVKELPLNGRSFDQLLALNPATVNYTAQRSGGIGTSNSSVGNMFSVGGRRPQDNLFLLNGIEYTGASLINVTPGGTSGELLGVDAVREFNVVTDTYGASYGKRDGAQVSHRHRLRDQHAARHGSSSSSATALSTPQLLRSVGRFPSSSATSSAERSADPSAKTSSFLFGNYEGFRQNWGLSASRSCPTTNARLGYLLPNSAPNPCRGLAYVGVNSAVAPLLNLWPVENGPELLSNGNPSGIAEAFSHPPQHINEDFGTTRFDDNLAQRIALRRLHR
jgi:hypothetical protein